MGVISVGLVSASCDSCNLCSRWIAKIADKHQLLGSLGSNWEHVPMPGHGEVVYGMAQEFNEVRVTCKPLLSLGLQAPIQEKD